MTTKQRVKKKLFDKGIPKCTWMKKTFAQIDRDESLEHSCKYIPQIIAEKSEITEQRVRTIRNVFHYAFKLKEPILKALEAEEERLSTEKIWEKIGISDDFLYQRKKKWFVALTRSLLCVMEDEGRVKSYPGSNGTVWEITDTK